MNHIPFDLELYRCQMQELIGSADNFDIFWEALDFAAIAHQNQWRKSGDAYILHSCSVAKILIEEMDVDNPEILSAALLHDTIEDVKEVTPELVGKKFGNYVRRIVEGCTKVTHISGGAAHIAGRRQTLTRKTHQKIFACAAETPQVMLVKLADRLHNLRTLDAMVEKKRKRVAEETLAIYAPVANILGFFNIKREMYDIALRYKSPKGWRRTRRHIAEVKKQPLAGDIAATLRKAITTAGKSCKVTVKTRGIWAYYDLSNNVWLDKIDIPQEITMLAETPQSCYDILGVVNQTYPPIPRTIRDFIANPKQTGYQALHAKAMVAGQRFLFKLRTREMEHKAQRGMLRNWTAKGRRDGAFFEYLKELFDTLSRGDAGSYRDVLAANEVKEIYTYTPKGEQFQLPRGANVLDFAFKVHSRLGLSCTGAIIRSKRVKSSHILHDGEVVFVLRGDEPVRFEREMQEKCTTHRARKALGKSFARRRAKMTLEVGRSVFSQELGRYGLTMEIVDGGGEKRLLGSFGLSSVEQFYREIGEGRLRLRSVMEKVTGLFNVPGTERSAGSSLYNRIELTTLDPVTVKLSSCCKPDPAKEENIGLLTDGGVSVHRRACRRLDELELHCEDIVEVVWEKHKTHIRKAQGCVIPEASRGELLRVLAGAPQEMQLLGVEKISKEQATPAWEVLFDLRDLDALQQVHTFFDSCDFAVEFELEV